MKKTAIKNLLVALLIAGVAGCATLSPEQVAALQERASKRVTCVKGEDCEIKWGRAIAWVVRHSEWKIQTQTDNIIQTFGPSTQINTTASAFVVNKVPLGDGSYEIGMGSSCGNIFGCIPDALTLRASFNHFVLEGQ